MNTSGWIRLYRQTLDSDFWLSEEPFSSRSAFLHVLLSANWRDGVSHRKGHKVIIKRGQWLTSIRKLMDTFHWSKNRVYRWIELMKDHEMLVSENLGFGTLLTVVNYEKFQDRQHDDGHSDGHDDGHSDGHDDGHSDGHDDGHSDGHAVGTRYKNIEERIQNEETLITADAVPPSAEVPNPQPEPMRGSPEWYKLHYDDDFDD